MTRKKRAARRKIKTKPYLLILTLSAILLITLGATIYLLFLRPGTIRPTTPNTTPLPHPQHSSFTPVKQPVEEKITGHTASKTPPAAPQAALKEAAPPEDKKSLPHLAIIIDDIGFGGKITGKFIELPLNLNFSILPHSPKGKFWAQKAHDLGHDILLHLPLEPTSPKSDPGPGALYLKMSRQERYDTLAADLSEVPLALGVNNHMGSRYSENRPAMKDLLLILKKRGLFFVDSLTSSRSVGYQTAQDIGVRAAKRDIFLDNDQDIAKTVKQIKKLIAKAQKNGFAIGIGHPHSTTLAALIKSEDILKKEVELTAIHNMVK